jgi:hypothetical protein
MMYSISTSVTARRSDGAAEQLQNAGKARRLQNSGSIPGIPHPILLSLEKRLDMADCTKIAGKKKEL